LDAVAGGNDRKTVMQLLYDIHAASAGEPPHDNESECMGRAPIKLLAHTRKKSVSALTKKPSHVPQLQTAHKQVVPLLSAPSLSSSSSSAVSEDATARMVSDALLLHAWLRGLQLRSVNERVGRAPLVLLSAAELRMVPDSARASLLGLSGKTSAPELDPAVVERLWAEATASSSSETNVFSDGLVLCDVVASLRRSPLAGVVRGGTMLLSSGSASRRASALHNVELCFAALRQSQRMPLTLLYREVARSIVRDEDRAVLRALLKDVRAAFPAGALSARTGLPCGTLG